MPRKKKTELDDLMKLMKQKQELMLQLSKNPDNSEAKMNLRIAEARADYFREKIDNNLLRQLEEIDHPKAMNYEKFKEISLSVLNDKFPESDPSKQWQREGALVLMNHLKAFYDQERN